MCGISGIISRRGEPIAPHLIERVTDAVAHRGPDGRGFFFGPGFAFGHRRLSILDLSSNGDQPMKYCGRYWIIHNGEVYNFVELRCELEKAGHRFRTGTDTEVIVAAFAEWGTRCFERFNGMWALAIYDSQSEVIVLARDRFAVKPLYYIQTPEVFAFGSEIKQLLGFQSSIRANRETVVESLLSGIDGHNEQTFFQGIKIFPQAHYATYDLRSHSFRSSRYYQLAPDRSLTSLSEPDAIARLRELFEDAVSLRLRSDVRVGTCLSGGVDSSATSGVASILYHAAADAKFIGIHARATDPDRDESRWAHLAARHLGIDLHVVEPSETDFLTTIEDLIETQEEPFGSPSMFMGWQVFKRARELGCRVMLNGQGGDEVLLGYERYFAAFLRTLPPNRWYSEARKQANNSRLKIRDVALFSLYFTSPAIRINRLKQRSYLLPSLKAAHSFEAIRESTRSFRSLQEMQLLEITKLQLPHLLRYEDRNSMRHSIETRLPFLDYRLVEFAVSLRGDYKIRDGWTKYVLRSAMRNVLPSEIAWRRDKIGFEAPERSWLGVATPMMKDAIAASPMLAEITQHKRLVKDFHLLPLRRKWAYYMIAAWERHFGVSW